jgi:hypothetical protein
MERTVRAPLSVSIVLSQTQAPIPALNGPIFFSGRRLGFGDGLAAAWFDWFFFDIVVPPIAGFRGQRN